MSAYYGIVDARAKKVIYVTCVRDRDAAIMEFAAKSKAQVKGYKIRHITTKAKGKDKIAFWRHHTPGLAIYGHGDSICYYAVDYLKVINLRLNLT